MYEELKKLATDRANMMPEDDRDLVLALIAENERLSEEVELDNKIIAERDRLLAAIPACPVHGPCVPNAIEWVEKAMLMMRELSAENDRLRDVLGVDPRHHIGEATIEGLKDSRDQLKAENEALRKDAERYRFIRDADRSDGILDVDDLGLYAMESLDEVVDEAMSREGEVRQ